MAWPPEFLLAMGELERKIKAHGKSLGFDIVGITSAEPFLREERAAVERIRQGLMDGLPWYTEERVHYATHPEVLLEGAASVISLAISYLSDVPPYRRLPLPGFAAKSPATPGAKTITRCSRRSSGSFRPGCPRSRAMTSARGYSSTTAP